MRAKSLRLSWVFLCGYAALVIAVGEPVTAGLSAGLLFALARRRGVFDAPPPPLPREKLFIQVWAAS